jgi:hypothetical protein
MNLQKVGRQSGANKPGGVLRWYEGLFAPYKERGAVSLLEVGIQEGHSMRTWRDWFGQSASNLVGLDITFRHFVGATAGFTKRQADQSSRESLSAALGEEQFDIIIDDGSHMCTHQQITLGHLFKSHLKPGGIYIIEDMHTSQIGNEEAKPFQVGCPVTELTNYVLREILRSRRFCSSTITPEENKYLEENILDLVMHDCMFHKAAYRRKWGYSSQSCIWKKETP